MGKDWVLFPMTGKKAWLPSLIAPIRCFTEGPKVTVKVTQSHPNLCNPMDDAVQGILQIRIVEWVAFPFSRGSSKPRDQTQVSHIAGGFFTSWAIREALASVIRQEKEINGIQIGKEKTKPSPFTKTWMFYIENLLQKLQKTRTNKRIEKTSA